MASLLSLALHSKLEYLTDIMRTLLGDLAAHYVHKNPKLMLRRLALTWVWGQGQGFTSHPFPIYTEWDVALRLGARNSGSRVSEDFWIILTKALGVFFTQDGDNGREAAHQLAIHLSLCLLKGERCF